MKEKMARLRAVMEAHNVLRESYRRVHEHVGKAQSAKPDEVAAAMREYQRIMDGLENEVNTLIDQLAAEALKDDPLATKDES
ncbi:hypothetical protein ACIBCT_35195 [Streptosporangium sp. NPDC050855]|uniref:hypothetical protein n=1 Tax=Streptosporangium sp. NPDC050855 TaxID=3366194 RepID=UPI0037891C5B